MMNKCSHAKSLLVPVIQAKFSISEEAAMKTVDAGRDGGSVVLILKHAVAESREIIKLYSRDGLAHTLKVCPQAQAALNRLGVEFDLEQHVAEVNDPPRR